ncbi:MAG: GAF domain-containing protein, partial [bacterium]|nr:GAF domain-containing protein [bacterium]
MATGINQRAKFIARALGNAQGVFNKAELAPNIAADLLKAMDAAFFGFFYPENDNFSGSIHFAVKGEKSRPCNFPAVIDNVITKTYFNNEIINLPEYSESHIDNILYLKKSVGGSLLTVPVQKTQTVGVLIFGKPADSGGFSPEDVELVQIIADSIASLLIRLREREILTEEIDGVSWRNKQLSVLSNAGRTISSILDPNTMLKTLLDELGKAIPYDKAAAYVYNESEDSFDDIITCGLSTDEQNLERTKANSSFAHKVVSEGGVFLSGDTSQLADSDLSPNLSAISLLIIPFGSKGKCFGAIGLGKNNPDYFDETDSSLLQAFGDYAATAIENSRLFEGERKRGLQLALINEAGKSAVLTLQRDELLHRIASDIRNKFHYYNVSIYNVNELEGTVELATSVGSNEGSIPLGTSQKIDIGVIGKVASEAKPILINNVDKAKEYVRPPDARDKTKSELYIPVVIHGKTTCVIDIQGLRVNAFDQNDITALETLADQVSIAIENSKFFEEATKRAAEMALINEIGRNILGEVESQELFKNIVTLINGKFGFFNTALFLAGREKRGDIRLAASSGAYDELVTVGQTLRNDKGFIGIAFETGEVVFSNNASEDPRFANNPIPDITLSEVALPIKISGDVIAVLDVQQNRRNGFSDTDVETLRILSDQIAIAIHNSNLFLRERNATKDAETLLHINEIISQTLDLEEALDKLVAETKTAIGFSFTGLVSVNEKGNLNEYQSFSGLSNQLEKKILTNEIELLTPLFFDRILDAAHPLFIEDISKIEGFADNTGEVFDISSIAFAPITKKGRLLGVIFGGWKSEERAIDEGCLNLLEGIALLTSIAIENLTYMDELGEHSEYLLLLSSIATDASKLSSIPELLNNALKRILRFLDVETGLITFSGKPDDDFEVAAAIGIDDKIAADIASNTSKETLEKDGYFSPDAEYYGNIPESHPLTNVIPADFNPRRTIVCSLI